MMIVTHEFSMMKKCKVLVIFVIIAGGWFFVSSCGKADPSESGAGVSSDVHAGDGSSENAGAGNGDLNSLPAQARLADAMVTGVRYHGVSIKADRFDPVSGMIYGVRVTAEGYLLSADHAEIVVNYADETARLILYDAVSVAVPTYSEEKITGNDEGEMTTYERLELEPFSIKD